MRKIYYSLVVLVAVMVSAMQAKAEHFTPVDGGTYHLVFTRYNNNLSIGESEIDKGTLVSADLDWNNPAQKWTVAKSGDDYTFTNGNGDVMYFDGSKFKLGTDYTEGQELMNLRHSTAGAPYGTDAWVIAPKGNDKSMNPIGGSVAGKQLGLYYDNDGGNAVKIANPKILLDLEMPVYETVLTTIPAGTNPGQVTEEGQDAFLAKINEVKGINDANHYAQAYVDAIETLKQAKTAFLSTVVLPQAGRRYYIQGTRPSNTYLTSNGAGKKLTDSPVIPNNTQLWEVVVNGDGFALKNVDTGEYLNTDVGASPKDVNTVVEMPSKTLSFVASSDVRENQVAFYVEGEDFLLHAGGSYAMNYTGGGKKDNQTWLFFDATAAAKKFLQLKISDLTKIKKNTPIGDDFGQYKQADNDALQSVIEAAQAVYDNTNSTSADIEAQMQSINDAINTYRTKINVEIGSLVGTDEAKYRWYSIRNASKVEYCKGKVMTSNGVTDRFKFEDKSDSEDQLFRFEVVGDKVTIINKTNGKYIGTKGATSDSGVEFSLNLLEDAYSFNITEEGQNPLHAQKANSVIVSWGGTAESPSAWVFDFVKETLINGIEDITDAGLSIVVANGKINVLGVDNFSIFTITGQRVNANQVLKAGVYVVKVNNATQKVIVK